MATVVSKIPTSNPAIILGVRLFIANNEVNIRILRRKDTISPRNPSSRKKTVCIVFAEAGKQSLELHCESAGPYTTGSTKK